MSCKEHKWARRSNYSTHSNKGVVLIYLCNNCLAVKVIQENDDPNKDGLNGRTDPQVTIVEC